jgi:hypothetical protein
MPKQNYFKCDKSKEVSPYFHSIKGDIDWSIFGTLTWNDKRSDKLFERRTNEWVRYTPRRVLGRGRNEWCRKHDFNYLMLETCRQLRIRDRKLCYYQTLELDALEGAHYHFLIAHNGIANVSPAMLADCISNIWLLQKPFDSQERGFGRSEIRPYEQALGSAGVKYCLKLQKDERGDLREKFDNLSNGLIRLASAIKNR